MTVDPPVKQKRVAYYTLGCRLNQYDSESIRALLDRDGGYQTVPFRESADIYVVNTCSVTARADATSRKAIRRIHDKDPAAKILVTGCYAQRAPGELESLPGVSVILGVADRAGAAEALALPRANQARRLVSPIAAAKKFLDLPITEMMEHSRAFVKIQEGCDEACTFCIVPQTRGRSRSREPASVLSQVAGLIEAGYGEIVLTGVHLGDYGLDLPGAKRQLAVVMRQILDLPGLLRLRLSSIEPASITDEIVDLMSSETRLANHFHIPMQSGSDRILRGMKRRYSNRRFINLVERIAAAVPMCGIGVDVICGFPGETDEDFQMTFNTLDELPVTYLHPFSYSVRPGSAAAIHRDDVGSDIKKRRVRALKRLARGKNQAFRQAHLGLEVQVLLESAQRLEAGGAVRGWTENYLRVELPNDSAREGMVAVKIGGLSESGLFGIAQPAAAGRSANPAAIIS